MSRADDAIRLLAGPRARARVERDGLRPRDVVAVAAAAGGPKGLGLLPMDRWLFGEWLPREAPSRGTRLLAGASIGAWRMAACAQRDPLPALDRLERAYLERQRYPVRPGTAHVAQVCRQIVRDLLAEDPRAFEAARDPRATLAVVTARSARRRDGPLAAAAATAGPAPTAPAAEAMTTARPAGTPRATEPAAAQPTEPAAPRAAGPAVPRARFDAGSVALRARFARAALSNALGRERLAAHLSRVTFVAGDAATAAAALPPDRFGARIVPLARGNLEDALLASGTIPLLADAVRAIDGAPAGDYWDGGLIDYHLYWRWSALDGLVLFPHFVPSVTAGWLDKVLPWRRHGIGPAGRGWLDDLLLVVPSAALLARLPGGKLPERADFYRYLLEHDARLDHWRRAIGECARMAEAFARFVERPDPSRLEPLPA